MDEPLASLDDERKAEILPYIERLRDETRIPIVYVSHSVAEVARLATDLVLMSAGKVVASGQAGEVLSRLDVGRGGPQEAGALIELTVEGQDDAFGLTVLRSSGGLWRLPRIEAPAGSRIRAFVRARDVMIALREPLDISALNVLAGSVEDIAADGGADALVAIRCGGDRLVARITRRSLAGLGLAAGRPVFAIIKSVAFDRGNSAYGTGSTFPGIAL